MNYTAEQLKMVAEALECWGLYKDKKYWEYMIREKRFKIWLLSPEGERAIRDWLFREGIGLAEQWYYGIGNKRFYVYSIAGADPVDGINETRWYHAVITRNATTQQIIIDNGTPSSNTRNYTQGNKTNLYLFSGYYGKWPNKIDQVRIYDRVLTSAEITALYNES